MIGIGIGAAAAVAIVAAAFAMSGSEIIPPQDNAAVDAHTMKVKVIASFFPLYDFTRQVAGDRAEVSVMVPPGVEPHDWEPTPRQIQDARNADMLVFNGAGFEAWVERIDAKFAVNTSEGLELLASEGHDEEHEEGEGHEEERDDEHEHGAFDPHIWLNPVLAKHQVEMIRSGLVTIDPENADYYNTNAARFSSELDELDIFIASELSSCEKSEFIAFHEAFSYFALRYGLTQHAVHQSSPEGEILPQRLRDVINLARQLGISVVYSEDLVDPRLAEVIASELPNGRVLILSPIEGLTDEEQRAEIGYLEKMRQNVANLKEGLICS